MPAEAVPQETIAQIQALAAQGLTGMQIRRTLGVSHYAAYHYGNPERVHKSSRVTPEQAREFQTLRDRGYSLEQISGICGVSVPTICKHTKNNRKTEQEEQRAAERNKICDMYRSGLSQSRIAQRLGCSIGHVSTVLSENRIYTRRRYKADGGRYRGTVRALARAGWSSTAIASELSATAEWVDGVIADINRKEGLEYLNDSAYWKKCGNQSGWNKDRGV